MRAYMLVLGIILSAGVQALETLSSDELLALCQAEEDPASKVCTAYINGFLDGAFATDPRVVESVLSEMQQEESFSERAIRTRLGISIERFGPSYYAGFCIPAAMPVATIVLELQEAMQADSGSYAQKNARDYLYELLQSKHPCQGEDSALSGR